MHLDMKTPPWIFQINLEINSRLASANLREDSNLELIYIYMLLNCVDIQSYHQSMPLYTFQMVETAKMSR